MSGKTYLSCRQLLLPFVTIIATVMLTLLLVVGPTPGNGAVSVPVKVTCSDIYRIRSMSLLPLGLFYIIQGVSDVQCYARCLLSTRCLSVNYKRTNQTCEMSTLSVNAATSVTPISLIDKDEYHHYMDKMDIPIGLLGRSAAKIPSPTCSLDDKTGHIIEEKGGELLAHTSCQINGLTARCDTATNTWLPHTPNCAGTPPKVLSNAKYTRIANEVTYECVDGNGNVTFSNYDVVTRAWSLPDMDCTPLPSNWDDPSPLPVVGVVTSVVRPYDGVESHLAKKLKGDDCLVQHRCSVLTGNQPITSCPVSRCDGYFNWTDATLSCSVKDCFGGSGYEGHVACTVGGIPCQRWDAQTPQSHSIKRGRSDLQNWCVMSSYELLPWCYTTVPGIRWDFCPVDDCSDYH